MRFFRLADNERYGMIIRADGRDQRAYIPWCNEWKKTGLLFEYTYDESDLYDLYDEISEEEALKEVEIQRTEARVQNTEKRAAG